MIENRELHPISEYIPTRELNNDENQDKQQNRKTPKGNDIIQYKLQNSDEWIKASVTGRAGKATGKNKYWYNIKEDLSEEKKSINLEQVDWELLNGVANVNLVQKNGCRINEISEAKLTELEKLCHFDTYQKCRIVASIHCQQDGLLQTKMGRQRLGWLLGVLKKNILCLEIVQQ